MSSVYGTGRPGKGVFGRVLLGLLYATAIMKDSAKQSFVTLFSSGMS
jgi:hypothetical protein